jgi:hypothetical protein
VQNKNSSTLVLDLTGAAGSGVGSISFGSTGLTPAVATDGDVVVAGTLAVANGGTGVTTATGTGSVVRATSPTVTGPTVSSGNLAFSGTAQRITGDFTNATVANRLMFQTSTVNGNTSVTAIPNGTSVQSNLRAFNNSDPTNASFADIGVDTTIGAFVRADRTGSGTYLPITFSTGGSERVRVDTSGNVGIGTASPGAVFHTVRTSAGAATVGAFIQNSDNTTSTEVRLAFAANSAPLSADRYGWIGHVNTGGTNGGALTFATTPGGAPATERMRIDSSGNVGIGTASPGDRLDVVGGNIRIASGNTVRWVDAGNIRASIQGDSSSNAIFSTAGTERLRIDSSGNVGIGTASPTVALDVFRSGTTTSNLAVRNGTVGTVLFVDSGAGYAGTTTAHPQLFLTNNTERLRIDSSGNINVATLGARITADFSNATLTNRVAFQTSTANSATSVTALPNGSSTDSNFTVSANSDPTNASVGQLRASSSAVVVASTRTGSGTYLPLQFQTSGGVAMSIDTGINVIQGVSALSTTATAGFLWITSCAGIPTGAPTAPYTNAAAMVCDTTNNRLYVRVGSTWRYTTLT